MAQVTSKMPGSLRATNAAVAVPQAGSTQILDLNVEDISFLGVSIAVTSKLLGGFVIWAKMSPDDAFQIVRNSAGQFTAPTGIVLDASGDLTIQAAATSGWLLLDVLPFYAVQIYASSGDAAGSTVTAVATGKN